MASIHIGNRKTHLFIGTAKVKKAYLGSTKVYSSGNIVTYHITDTESYQEEIDSDASCLSPTTFLPEMDGFTFAGWRRDKEPNGAVLSHMDMGDEPISLYAVFKKTVILTLYNNTTAPVVQSGIKYHNNGNSASPKFTQTAAPKESWSFRGWSESKDPSGQITYHSLNNQPVVETCTLYGIYYKDITVTYYNNSTSPSTQKGTAYYNSSNTTSYPAFTQPANPKTDWTFRGWSTSASANCNVDYNQINHTLITANITLYAAYLRTVYLYYGLSKDEYNTNNSHVTGTCYYNSKGNYQSVSFTVSENIFDNGKKAFMYWSAVNGSAIYNPGDTIVMDGSNPSYTIAAVWCTPYTFFERDLWETTDSGYALSLNEWNRNRDMEFATELGPADWYYNFVNHYMQIKVCRTAVNYGRITVWHKNVPTYNCRYMELCIAWKNGYHDFNIALQVSGGETIEADPKTFPAYIKLNIPPGRDKIDFAIRVQSEQYDERYNTVHIKTMRFY